MVVTQDVLKNFEREARQHKDEISVNEAVMCSKKEDGKMGCVRVDHWITNAQMFGLNNEEIIEALAYRGGKVR